MRTGWESEEEDERVRVKKMYSESKGQRGEGEDDGEEDGVRRAGCMEWKGVCWEGMLHLTWFLASMFYTFGFVLYCV